jgi:hypothetical protein
VEIVGAVIGVYAAIEMARSFSHDYPTDALVDVILLVGPVSVAVPAVRRYRGLALLVSGLLPAVYLVIADSSQEHAGRVALAAAAMALTGVLARGRARAPARAEPQP